MTPAAPRKPDLWAQFTESQMRKIVARRFPGKHRLLVRMATRERLVEMLAKEKAS